MPREPLISTSALSTGCARERCDEVFPVGEERDPGGLRFHAGMGPGEFRADEHHFCLRSLRCEADDSGVFLLGPGAQFEHIAQDQQAAGTRAGGSARKFATDARILEGLAL